MTLIAGRKRFTRSYMKSFPVMAGKSFGPFGPGIDQPTDKKTFNVQWSLNKAKLTSLQIRGSGSFLSHLINELLKRIASNSCIGGQYQIQLLQVECSHEFFLVSHASSRTEFCPFRCPFLIPVFVFLSSSGWRLRRAGYFVYLGLMRSILEGWGSASFDTASGSGLSSSCARRKLKLNDVA